MEQGLQRGHGCALFTTPFSHGKISLPLSNPLHVKVEMDTDETVPEQWTPPILVEEFEEIED